MVDVLSKGNLFRVCENRSLSISNKRKSFCKSQSFDGLTFCSKNRRFFGARLDFGDRIGKPVKGNLHAISPQMTLSFPKAMKWWRKGLHPNMKGIESAQDLVDSLLNAGNKLVIVDFFSPGCGGCKALYPKICQFAETNPNVLFLQVNYEEHKSMCCSLNVHVLPFFRFYRGANGRLCSFSCTNATIKKFKDALAKHSTERCSLDPAKGLEESELLALSSNEELSFTYTRNPIPAVNLNGINGTAPSSPKLPAVQSSSGNIQEPVGKNLITYGR